MTLDTVNNDRPPLLTGLLLFLAATHLACGAGTPEWRMPAPVQPNVILFSMDTLRADHLSLYGYERQTSPNIDRLAAQSMVFDLAIAQASSTLPSHSSLFQSRLASQTGTDYPMLAELLKKAGYQTAAFTGGGNVSATFGFGRGFDIYMESRDPHGRMFDIFPDFEHWMRTERNSPFFVFLHCFDIHHPYDPPAPYSDTFYPDYTGDITGKATGQLLNKVRRIHSFADLKGDVELGADDRFKIESLYDDGILYIDSFIPRIEALLEELRLNQNTHIVLLSDHGEEFWEHGSVLHSFTLYQEVLHVPLVIRHAGGYGAGMRIPEMVRLMDVAPTILDLLGLPMPNSMTGHSLLPGTRGLQYPKTAVSEMNTLKMWFEPPWKIILSRDPLQVELYNLAEDAAEIRDLSAEYQDTATRLLADMVDHLGPAASRPVSGSAKVEPELEGLREQLRALGYIE